MGEALDHPFERTGLFFDLLLGKCLFVGGEFGWSATAWLIMQTLGAMVFPCRDPGRHSHAMHLIGLGNGLDGCARGTQQQTVGAAPRAECGILFLKCCSNEAKEPLRAAYNQADTASGGRQSLS